MIDYPYRFYFTGFVRTSIIDDDQLVGERRILGLEKKLSSALVSVIETYTCRSSR